MYPLFADGSVKGRVLVNEPLARHTSIKIGGAARYFIEPADVQDLRRLLVRAKRYKIPISVIGAGTNILAADRGLKKIVLRLGSGCFKRIYCVDMRLSCGSGASLAQVLAAASAKNLGGAEFLAGIPGTLGGALCGNAGAWGSDIASIVERVTVMDRRGRLVSLGRKKIKFGYRSSSLAKYVILSAVLKLKADRAANIRKKISAYLKQRRVKLDFTFANAGCVFKNPRLTMPAGRLIDLCGLKGAEVNGAVISRKHANFILNRGGAKADDVLKLMRLIRKKVKDRFGINLQPEIKIWR